MKVIDRIENQTALFQRKVYRERQRRE